MAAAGIKSLNLNEKISFIFEKEDLLPAVGQGIIAVQCRKKNKQILNLINQINDSKTSLCARAERKMLQIIGGSCETAIGGLAEIENDNLKLKNIIEFVENNYSLSFEESLKFIMNILSNNKIYIVLKKIYKKFEKKIFYLEHLIYNKVNIEKDVID